MGRPRQGKEDIVVKCGAFVANAAVYGDVFRWHVDADPTSLAPSPWTERYGYYFNRVCQAWSRTGPLPPGRTNSSQVLTAHACAGEGQALVREPAALLEQGMGPGQRCRNALLGQ
eukprot:9860268-Ditylum_brightwellii.AAC.1